MVATALLLSACVGFLTGPAPLVRHVAAPASRAAALSASAVAAPQQRRYTQKEVPKVAGGVLVGTRRVVVVTGASSGLGLSAAKALCDQGYFVIAAVRDPSKMDAAAKESGIP